MCVLIYYLYIIMSIFPGSQVYKVQILYCSSCLVYDVTPVLPLTHFVLWA